MELGSTTPLVCKVPGVSFFTVFVCCGPQTTSQRWPSVFPCTFGTHNIRQFAKANKNDEARTPRTGLRGGPGALDQVTALVEAETRPGMNPSPEVRLRSRLTYNQRVRYKVWRRFP